MATESLSAATAEKMSPIDWAIRPFRRYVDFKGRAPRAEYWWFYLGTIIVQIPLTLVDKFIASWGPLSTAFSLAALLPWLAVTVRRLHDTDRSAWWLLVFVAAFGLIGAMAEIGSRGALAGSTAFSFTTGIVAVLLVLFALITFLVFMVLPGTEGPNRYGADPYGPDQLEEVFA